MLYGYTTFCLSAYNLMDIWLVSTFWLLWIMLLWTFIYKFLCGCQYFSCVCYLVVDLLGYMVIICFNLLKNCQPFFHHGCTILQSQFYQYCIRAPVSPYLHQHLLLSLFSIIAILVHVKWYLIVVLVDVSLTIDEVELLFMWLLISFLEKYLFKFFAHLKFGLSFYWWVVRVLDISYI